MSASERERVRPYHMVAPRRSLRRELETHLDREHDGWRSVLPKSTGLAELARWHAWTHREDAS